MKIKSPDLFVANIVDYKYFTYLQAVGRSLNNVTMLTFT